MPILFYRMFKGHLDGFDLKLTIHFAQACCQLKLKEIPNAKKGMSFEPHYYI